MERDTDADWRKIGATEPFWGVLTEDRFRRDRMDQAAKHAFYATGAEDIGFVLSRIQLMVPHFRPRQALDFGCGVGRLTLAMARHADAVTDVDISPEMLDEARRAASELGVRNVAFRNELPEKDKAAFDWVSSHIVFQHIPPNRGYALLRDLVGLLAPGGICSIQLCFLRDQANAGEFVGYSRFWSFDEDAAHAGLDQDPNPVGTVRMYDYDLNRVFAAMLAHKVELFGIAPTDHGGHHGAWFFGRRSGTP